MMSSPLTLDVVRAAVAGRAAAFRAVTEYQPAGGSGDKVAPPTYEKATYATENRMVDGATVPCVLLDSVQSQANRMELALLEAWQRGDITLPVVSVTFAGEGILRPFRVTSLDAPHRLADALLRDSLLDGTPFRQSDVGRVLDEGGTANATGLFGACPTALALGIWDSTGPRGGLGVKIQRAVVSEIVGINAVPGKRTSSRIDPAQILLGAGPLYLSTEGDGIPWTLDDKDARQVKGRPAKLGKDGKPSEANHGNVTPSISDGTYTIEHARQTTVISLPALRRLQFPVDGAAISTSSVDTAARTVLVALSLCAATLAHAEGCDLRSRCLLVPTAPFRWQIIGAPDADVSTYALSAEESVALLNEAVVTAKALGLPWNDREVALTPSPQLLELVRRSQQLAAAAPAGE